MARPLSAALLLLVCSTACVRRPQVNSDCEWPQEKDASALNASLHSQRHVSDDAEFAEDLGICYADVRRAPHSGHFEGFPEYDRTREQCIAVLFKVIANNHGVTEEQVRQARGQRRTGLDLAVLVSFAVLYTWIASFAARWLGRLYARKEESLTRMVITVFTSAAVSAAGVLLGEQWSLIVEAIRLSNGHLSYRVGRIPWGHHRLELFVGGIVLFWLVTAMHLARPSSSDSRAEFLTSN